MNEKTKDKKTDPVVYIPPPYAEQLLRISYESDQTIEEIVENAIIHYLERSHENG